jgi:hypothetical protein
VPDRDEDAGHAPYFSIAQRKRSRRSGAMATRKSSGIMARL